MSLQAAESAAREGRLYPAVILHGGSAGARRAAALRLARLLLCEAPVVDRPCGVCRHCRRIVWPGEGDAFHPDFTVVARDLKSATSVEAARGVVQAAQSMPFEARGQVFAIAEADSLSIEAANALLKLLEEPPSRSPRHFLLLCPSRLDLLPTLRSRSLAIYLGPAEALDPETVDEAAARFSGALDAYLLSRAPIYLLAAAGALATAGDFADPRAGRPWSLAAAAVERSSQRPELEPAWRRALLALAEDLLGGSELRLRNLAPERILEGLVARRLAEAELG